MTVGGTRRVVGVTAFVGVVITLLGLLWLLAGSLTRHALQRAAQAELSQWNDHSSPWHWHLTDASDVVGGRAFGAATLRSVDGMLLAQSVDGSAYEIGLPMPRDADVRTTPLLRANLTTTPSTQLWLEQRQSPRAALCLASVATNGTPSTTWLLPAMHWRDSAGRPCAVPRRISMLRLRVQQPTGGHVAMGTLVLRPRHIPRVQSANHAMVLPAESVAARKILVAAATQPTAGILPRVVVPDWLSPGRTLALRDLAHALLPTALITTDAHAVLVAEANAEASPAASRRWLGAALYGLILLGIGLYPWRNRARAVCEIAGCLAGPLWLIAGLNLDKHSTVADLVPFALGLGFAVLIQWRDRPLDWRWSGPAFAWWLPLAVLPAGLLLALLWAHIPAQWPTPRQVTVYLLWATVQQWLMLTVVLTRLRNLLPDGAAIIACATLFALLHTPNAHLMQVCLLVQLWWAWCFVRSRALVPIAVAHAVGALLLQATLPDGWLRSLEVSAGFFSN